jgi:hypothetical protein
MVNNTRAHTPGEFYALFKIIHDYGADNQCIIALYGRQKRALI